jgi:two-component system sensor histidine kinase ChiS
MSDPDSKLKVLLIDDDNFLLELYALKFTKAGYEPQSMTSAVEGIAKIEEGYVPDIILLDIIMPKMDGLEFLKVLREKKLAQNSTIVVLSNQGSPQDIKKAQELGAHGYIIKATTIPSEVVTEVGKIHKSITASRGK